MDLQELQLKLDIGSLIPEAYGPYRSIVADGLWYLLEALSSRRTAELLAEQGALPPDAPAPLRAVTLAHACPTLHKLGQVIARDRRLEPAFRRLLQTLETREPHTPLWQVVPLIERELGSAIRDYSIRLDDAPLAEASVAVVVPFTWHDADFDQRRDGVFKVLRPGISAKLDEELASLARTADFLDQRRSEYGLPEFAFREAFDTTAELLRNEVRPTVEQAHLVRASARWDDSALVHVPRLLELSTPRLTALERIFGAPVAQFAAESPAGRAGLARLIVHACVTDVVFAEEEAVLFHGDPHGGNLFVREDGQLVLLDWSLAGELDRQTRSELAQAVVGALLLDRDHVCRALAALAERLPADAVTADLVESALGRVRQGTLPGLSWLVRLLDELARAGAVFPSEALLFRKALHTLEGVIADVSSECSIDVLFTAAAVRTLAAEWPARFGRSFDSREWPSGLSNADLLRAMVSVPAAATRFWTRTWTDFWTRAYPGGTHT